MAARLLKGLHPRAEASEEQLAMAMLVAQQMAQVYHLLCFILFLALHLTSMVETKKLEPSGHCLTTYLSLQSWKWQTNPP